MKENAVLVIGSGGASKFGYLEELAKLRENILLIDGLDRLHTTYPQGIITTFLPTLDLNSVLNQVKEFNKTFNITNVGTISEPCMETAAQVRDFLKLPGFGHDQILISRNKGLMSRFLSDARVKVPSSVIFNRNFSKEKIVSLAKQFHTPFILKPTMGSSNRGLRFVRSIDNFWECYEQALKDVSDYSGKIYECFNLSDEWMICEYIRGKEVEVDIYVEDGKVIFKAIREKPIIFERENTLEENSTIMPPLTLTQKETNDFENEIKKLSQSVCEKIASPCSVRYFTIFAEFRIDKDGNFYCLEFTLRPAGALCPMIIEKVTGVNIFEIAAKCTLGEKPIIKQNPARNSAYLQILYSDRCGIFRGIENLANIEGTSFIPNKKVGDIIKLPYADYLAFVIIEGKNQADAISKTIKYLENARVLVETENGSLEQIIIPVPKLPGNFALI